MSEASRGNRLWIAWLAGVAGAVAVIVAQFMDYTGFQINSSGEPGAIEVAPAPFIEGTKASVGSDQLWLGILLGLAALGALWFARSGQWRLGRTIAAIGGVLLILTLAVLLPNAIDGSAGGELGSAVAASYDVEEKLLAGFWVQLLGSVALIGSGIAMVRWRPRP